MILRRLELRRFGKFAERTFDFRRGMNLVHGPNEAGKTTLMEAIPAVLFGVRDKERFKPWGGGEGCAAALVFEGRQRFVRIDRDLLSDRVELVELDDQGQELHRFAGQVAPEAGGLRGEYAQQLARLFGFAEEAVFRSSLFFGQGYLDMPGQAAMTAKIKALLSGSGQIDFDQVLAALRADLAAVTRDHPWGGAREGDRELETVTQGIAALEERWFEGRKSLQELEALRDAMAELERSIRFDRDEYGKGERYLAWVRKQWQGESSAPAAPPTSAPSIRLPVAGDDLEKERQSLEKELAKTGLPREIPEDLVKILVDADEERKELVALQGESAALRRELLSHKSPPWKGSAGASALLLSGGVGLSWVFPAHLSWLLLGSGLLTACLWLVYLARAGKERAERGRIQGQAQVVERKREEVQARLATLDGRFERLGLSPSAVEIVKMQKNLPRHQELLWRLKEVDNALRALAKSDGLPDEVPEVPAETSAPAVAEEQPKPARADGLLSLEELPAAEDKLRELGESLREREARLLEMTRREAALAGASGDLRRIEAEGERLKTRELALRRRRDVLGTAGELLDGAVREFRGTYQERFAEDIGAYLASATAGRYSRVRLDENFSLTLPGAGERGWQPLGGFSRGTVDAVYLAVRLALTRHLSHGRKLPFFLDDPLVNFDGERLAEAVGVLENLARDHQMIFFTHNDGLLKRAGQKRWNVVSLDDAKVSRNRANEERKDDVGQLHLL